MEIQIKVSYKYIISFFINLQQEIFPISCRKTNGVILISRLATKKILYLPTDTWFDKKTKLKIIFLVGFLS